MAVEVGETFNSLIPTAARSLLTRSRLLSVALIFKAFVESYFSPKLTHLSNQDGFPHDWSPVGA